MLYILSERNEKAATNRIHIEMHIRKEKKTKQNSVLLFFTTLLRHVSLTLGFSRLSHPQTGTEMLTGHVFLGYGHYASWDRESSRRLVNTF